MCATCGGKDIGSVSDVKVALNTKVWAAGVWIDTTLSMQPHLEMIIGRIGAQSESLTSAVDEAGFGLPMLESQFQSRVEPSAMFGAEVLASFSADWKTADRRLNDAHYRAAKMMLGLRGVSSGDGGHVRALLESGFLTRLGSRMLQRALVARARLLCLPDDSPVAPVLRAAKLVRGETWLDHVRIMTYDIGARPDFPEFIDSCSFARATAVNRRGFVKKWKSDVVVPAIRRLEAAWFNEQLQALNDNGLITYAELVPLRKPEMLDLLYAKWGKTMWRFHRTWSVARITMCFPWAVWGDKGIPIPRHMVQCSLCGATAADLRHLFEDCVGLRSTRMLLTGGAWRITLVCLLRSDADAEQMTSR